MFDTKEVYNQNAKKWLRLEPSSLSDFTARPKVFDACGNLNGRSVLDIGCGEGYCARELKRRGAGDYLGIDLSDEMIQAGIARELVDQYGIEYLATNVVEYTPSRQFDLCIAVFLFNYLKVDEMQKVFAMVYKALVPGGEFVFSVPHPLFPFVRKEEEAPFYFESKGKNYFSNIDEQFQGKIWKKNGEPLHVQCVHKTFSDYFKALKNSGFRNIPEVEELTVTEDLVQLNRDFFGPLYNEPLHILFKISK